MRRLHTLLLPLVALLALLTTPALAQSDPAHTLTFDPVLLCAGREVPGDPALAVSRGRFTYHFADVASRDTFLADPERYEIQFNGACARMGPLSSGGDARRFAVHDHRLYVFASESCRQTFITHADKLLERDDRPLLPAGCEEEDGRELLEAAITWVGGREALTSLRTYIERRAVPYRSETESIDHHLTLALEFDADGAIARAFRQDDWHHYGAWGETLIAGESWSTARSGEDGPSEWTALVPTQQRVLERQLAVHLLVTLRAALRDDAVICRIALGEIEGIPVERVSIHHDGVTATLAIEPATGRILALAHTARGGPNGFVGQREHRFTRFEEVEGLRLPVEAAAHFDGEPEPRADTAALAIEVNAPLDESWFERPATGG